MRRSGVGRQHECNRSRFGADDRPPDRVGSGVKKTPVSAQSDVIASNIGC